MRAPEPITRTPVPVHLGKPTAIWPAGEGRHRSVTTQPSLTPAAFAAKWHGVTTTEKAAAQEHFIDLCRMLGEPDRAATTKARP
jgi:hypothetical protein